MRVATAISDWLLETLTSGRQFKRFWGQEIDILATFAALGLEILAGDAACGGQLEQLSGALHCLVAACLGFAALGPAILAGKAACGALFEQPSGALHCLVAACLGNSAVPTCNVVVNRGEESLADATFILLVVEFRRPF